MTKALQKAIASRLTIAGVSALTTWYPASAQSSQPSAAAATTPSTSVDFRTVTAADIIARKDPVEVRLSPDGRDVAFVVKEASLATNTYRYDLYLVPARGGKAPRKWLKGSGVAHVRWSPDGRSLWFLSMDAARPGLRRLSVKGGRGELGPGKLEQLGRCDGLSKRGPEETEFSVSAFELSPSGKQVALVGASRPVSAPSVDDTGVLYDDDTMTIFDLLRRSWHKPAAQIRVCDLNSGRQRLLWEGAGDLGGVAWSPDESSLAVSYSAPPRQQQSMVYWNQDIGIIDVQSGDLKTIADGESVDDHPAWSPDGNAVAFTSANDTGASLIVLDRRSGRRRELARGRLGPAVRQLWWDGGADRLIVEARDSGVTRRGTSGLYAVSLEGTSFREISPRSGHLSQCTFGSAFQVSACVVQGPMSPPEPALVDLSQGTVFGLAALNDAWRALRLGEVEERTWTNKYGASTNGFLVKPVGYVHGRSYPLLVVLYGFEGKFLSDAEWITSYPVQAFAGVGFAVLLMNYPRASPWPGTDFTAGSIAEGFSPLASVERAVQMLVEEGIADPLRLGVLGWSYGAFLAEFSLTQCNLFQAAAVGNGGDYNPGAYWVLGQRSIRERYEHVMGGPPYGSTLPNWTSFSPAFNASRVRAPVLMEFSNEEALYGLEMSVALRRNGVPVEFIVYPGEGHTIEQPRHRYHSMQRHLDWFRFWLQGYRPHEAAQDQKFQRWQRFREAAAARYTVAPLTEDRTPPSR